MKKYFFSVALVILVGQLACGEAPEGDVSEGDAGSDSLAPRRDALAPRTDSLSPGCEIPEPRVKSMWGAAVTTSPRGGYKTLADPVTCSTPGALKPKDCSRPVDGFSDGSSWCCVSVARPASGPSRPATSTTLYCFAEVSGFGSAYSSSPGNVALCSPEGKFVGWDCMDGG